MRFEAGSTPAGPTDSPVEQPGVLATVTGWRSLVRIQPGLLTITPVAQRRGHLLHREGSAGSSPAGGTDCGVDWSRFPARPHKPSDAGSNPASATQDRGALDLRAAGQEPGLATAGEGAAAGW